MGQTGTPEYKLGYIHDRQTIAILGGIWHDIRMEYDASDNLVYRGVHENHNAATTDEDWEVWKYTWSGVTCTRIEGPLRGAWDDRASLSWGA